MKMTELLPLKVHVAIHHNLNWNKLMGHSDDYSKFLSIINILSFFLKKQFLQEATKYVFMHN